MFDIILIGSAPPFLRVMLPSILIGVTAMDIVMAVAAWCSIVGFIFDSAERIQSRKKREKKMVPRK